MKEICLSVCLCITDDKGGARVMMQTELMAAKGFTQATSNQLRELPGVEVQPIIADTAPYV